MKLTTKQHWTIHVASMAVVLLLILLIWTQGVMPGGRYRAVNGKDGIYKIDRATGEMWLTRGNRIVPVSAPAPVSEQSQQRIELGTGDVARISGRLGLSVLGRDVSGHIYNGTNYHLTELVVDVIQDGEQKRRYRTDVNAAALTSTSIFITTGANGKVSNWKIVKAFARK